MLLFFILHIVIQDRNLLLYIQEDNISTLHAPNFYLFSLARRDPIHVYKNHSSAAT